MTPNEFKAWFDGFCEAFTGTPTKAQWARIKERVAEIDGKPVTEKVFVDRYVPYARPWNWQGYWPYYSGTTGGGAYTSNLTGMGLNYQNALQGAGQLSAERQMMGYNSIAAMALLGRAESQAMS